VLESPACCSVLLMTPTRKATFRLSVLTSYVDIDSAGLRAGMFMLTHMPQKIRTIELDGKTVKLQIVRLLTGMWS